MNAYVGGGDETADTDTAPKFHLAKGRELTTMATIQI